MLRNIFGQFRYREVRAEIEQIIASPTLLYLAKIKQVDTLLRKLTQNLISFIEYDEKVLQQLGAITNCNLQTNKTVCAAKPFCMASDTTDACAILVPRINLINGKQNEAVYFGRLADEDFFGPMLLGMLCVIRSICITFVVHTICYNLYVYITYYMSVILMCS